LIVAVVGSGDHASMTRRSARWLCGAVMAAAVTGACGRSPRVAFARMLDRAASWAAAVQFAGEMRRAEAVPQSYVRDLRRRGADDLQSLRSEISQSDISPSMRSEASTLCGRLAAMFKAAALDEDAPAPNDLRAVERRLRALAEQARADDVRSGSGGVR
jgi:hypothetical protein